ncbi:MAG: family 16 glycosylhydrolase [Candidatus Omnitrophica bacterium]|nr:family 16 glycosylhydrolase [Candidatus Omnitrophota bacterium]
MDKSFHKRLCELACQQSIIFPVVFFVAVELSSVYCRPAFSETWSSAADSGKWRLIWHDEFDGETVDVSKWRIEDAALIKNNELQYYTPEDVYIENGMLVLRSQKRFMRGRGYTSGLVETSGKVAFKYGRVEVRAKLPKGKGLWPAHWMLPQSGKWPPEIDITELIGHSPNTVHMTLHWGQRPEHKLRGTSFSGPDFSGDFHVFAIEWQPDYIRWFIDGEERFFIDENIPQEPFYIILNTAVGGNWPGAPNSATKFPQFHQIDYVRVYAKEIPGKFFLTSAAKNGSIEISPQQQQYDFNSKVTLKAKPAIGYIFSCFSGDCSAEYDTVEIVMDKHKTISADFIADPDPPELLSAGKPVKASSQEAEDLGAENAVDRDKNTRWSSAFSDPQWIQVDLGQKYLIDSVRLNWEAAYARGFEIQVSDDGKKWNTVYGEQQGKGSTQEITQLNAAGRYVAIYGIERATEFGYSLWEFEVFGRFIETASAQEP